MLSVAVATFILPRIGVPGCARSNATVWVDTLPYRFCGGIGQRTRSSAPRKMKSQSRFSSYAGFFILSIPK
jgi:hypothetical protein